MVYNVNPTSIHQKVFFCRRGNFIFLEFMCVKAVKNQRIEQGLIHVFLRSCPRYTLSDPFRRNNEVLKHILSGHMETQGLLGTEWYYIKNTTKSIANCRLLENKSCTESLKTCSFSAHFVLKSLFQDEVLFFCVVDNYERLKSIFFTLQWPFLEIDLVLWFVDSWLMFLHCTHSRKIKTDLERLKKHSFVINYKQICSTGAWKLFCFRLKDLKKTLKIR